jgi:hypothetical protein
MKKEVLSIVLAVLLAAASALAQENPKLNPEDEVTITYAGSTLWGDMRDVAVRGNYAYCALRYGLMILDISNPDSPAFASKVYLDRGCGETWGVTVVGDYAYLADGSNGLQIIDVSNPLVLCPSNSLT